ncbi:S41 family peptidase [Pedobacter sp. SYSU D00535]|uniref:S41 family peptidase n=1 Tax=Pedobacter sp. SYSU D00535 TaxID=2810308 RepID=UPI001A96D6F7|nr:S41 family peptidase [Pedobacter sp. SYSU D00535]
MRSSTKKNLLIASFYAGTMVLGMFLGPRFQRENENRKNGTFIPFLNSRAEKVDRVLNIIEENYVDPVKKDTLQDMAINQILKKLDPHSAYLPPLEARNFSDNLDGKYTGIGVEYQTVGDTILITAVVDKGPAARGGVKPGDFLLAVDGKTVVGPNNSAERVSRLIKGQRGTSVELRVKRLAEEKRLLVKRDRITVSSIDIAYVVAEKVGYIKISKFGARTEDDFEEALKRLKEKGITSLILDLRGNGGGYLNAATALADHFLPDDKLIVYTQGEHEPRTDYYATAEGEFEQGKLVILIDENSASASEILAGAVQDLDRGTVIGRRSFGKGLVQEQFNFGDGSALNLTVARYYTPSGRSIQKPYKSGSDKYYAELAERYKSGELNGKHVDSVNDRHKSFKTTSGKAIYGGGGITPDIYVALDSTGYNDFYYALYSKGVMAAFTYSSLVKKYSAPASLGELIREFKLDDELFSQLLTAARLRGVQVDQKLAQTARPAIAARLKALLARYYFGEEAYYRTRHVNDKVISRSLEILKQP